MNSTLPWLLFLPLLVAALLPLLPARAGVARALTLAALVANLLLLAASPVSGSFTQPLLDLPWIPTLGVRFAFALDGLSFSLVALTLLVALAAVLVSPPDTPRPAAFHALLLVLTTGAMAAFCATDAFAFYFFFEFEVLCAFVLIAVWGRDLPGGPTASVAALRLTLYVAGGSVLVIFGLIALRAGAGGGFAWKDLLAARALSPALQTGILALLIAGFGAMLSVIPLHAWAPPAYAASPVAFRLLGAGVLKNIGFYGLLRFALPALPAGAAALAPVLAGAATVNLLYAGWVALRQKDWNGLVAYLAVSHAGYGLLGLAALSSAGFAGVAYVMVAHGFCTALLFAAVEVLARRSGTTALATGGWAARQKLVSVVLVSACLAACGQPGFGNFISEIMVFLAGWSGGSPSTRLATVAGIWTVVITATALLRALRASLFGPAPAESGAPLTASERAALLLLLAALVALGVWPRLLTVAVGPVTDLLARLALGGTP